MHLLPASLINPLLFCPWGLGGRPCLGTFAATPSSFLFKLMVKHIPLQLYSYCYWITNESTIFYPTQNPNTVCGCNENAVWIVLQWTVATFSWPLLHFSGVIRTLSFQAARLSEEVWKPRRCFVSAVHRLHPGDRRGLFSGGPGGISSVLHAICCNN